MSSAGVLLKLTNDWQLKCKGCLSCSLITTATESFSPRQQANTYEHDAECEWFLAPTDAYAVSISFVQFDTQKGADFVQVIECSNWECSSQSELAMLSGPVQLPSTSYSSRTGFMKVRFTSDSSIAGTGFNAYVNAGKV
jgi:hypothetical protein